MAARTEIDRKYLDLYSTLHHFGQSSKVVKQVFNFMYERERHRDITDVRQFYEQLVEKNIKATMEIVVSIFKHLHDQGVGIYFEGSATKPPRFKWGFDVRVVGASIKSKEDFAKKIIQLSKRRKSRAKRQLESSEKVNYLNQVHSQPSNSSASVLHINQHHHAKANVPAYAEGSFSAPNVLAPAPNSITVVFTTRKGDMVPLNFPPGFTQQEAYRLIDLIKSLHFPEK